VRREMEQSIVEREAARESLVAAQAARAAARESLELARLRYEAGLAASLDIVTAQGLLAEAEDFEIRTRYEYLLATARLARARGDVNGFFGML
jgi:outer membrane protein